MASLLMSINSLFQILLGYALSLFQYYVWLKEDTGLVLTDLLDDVKNDELNPTSDFTVQIDHFTGNCFCVLSFFTLLTIHFCDHCFQATRTICGWKAAFSMQLHLKISSILLSGRDYFWNLYLLFQFTYPQTQRTCRGEMAVYQSIQHFILFSLFRIFQLL